MSQQSQPPTPPSVVLVGETGPLLEALVLTLQRAGEIVVPARTAPVARLVLAAAPTISTLIARCHEPGEEAELNLLDELAATRPHLALIGLCGQTGHDHPDAAPASHFLAAPYELDDVRRTLASARLDAYGRR